MMMFDRVKLCVLWMQVRDRVSGRGWRLLLAILVWGLRAAVNVRMLLTKISRMLSRCGVHTA